MGLGKALNHFTRTVICGMEHCKGDCYVSGTENAALDRNSVSEGAALSLPPNWKLSNCCSKGAIS